MAEKAMERKALLGQLDLFSVCMHDWNIPVVEDMGLDDMSNMTKIKDIFRTTHSSEPVSMRDHALVRVGSTLRFVQIPSSSIVLSPRTPSGSLELWVRK